MVGPRQEAQAALVYEVRWDDHIPQDHVLRSVDRCVDLGTIRAHLSDFYSHTGRPSIDPERLIRRTGTRGRLAPQMLRVPCVRISMCSTRRPLLRRLR